MRTRQLNFLDELIVDNFAGGGGASTGIEMALGKPIDIAINHDPEAIAMHEANHPLIHVEAAQALREFLGAGGRIFNQIVCAIRRRLQDE